jgi:hypothetical protein
MLVLGYTYPSRTLLSESMEGYLDDIRIDILDIRIHFFVLLGIPYGFHPRKILRS